MLKSRVTQLLPLSYLLPFYLIRFIVYNLQWTIMTPTCDSEPANPTGILQVPPIFLENTLPFLCPCYTEVHNGDSLHFLVPAESYSE